MLNMFPIQFLAPFAYLVLRVCVGSILIYLGIRHLRSTRPLQVRLQEVTLYEGIIAVILTLGAFTQIAALGSVLFSVTHLLFHKKNADMLPRVFFVLLLFASFSIFITGAGVLGFDLPI